MKTSSQRGTVLIGSHGPDWQPDKVVGIKTHFGLVGCGHKVTLHIGPRKGDVLYCVRCATYRDWDNTSERQLRQ